MLQLDFTKKTVVITGGGSGIGLAIAEAFFDSGANVVIVGRREDVLKQAVTEIQNGRKENEGEIVSIVCDMSKEDDVRKLVEQVIGRFSRLDVFVNNAGAWIPAHIQEVKENDILEMVKNDLLTAILGTKHASLSMKNGGVIVNIGSFAGIMPQYGASIYASLKSAVHHFTRSAAAELAEKNIRVNCVIPGVIRTAMTSDYIEQNMDKILAPIPLRRIGTEKEVANGVLFLASDLAQYITGASLEVTGGKYSTQI